MRKIRRNILERPECFALDYTHPLADGLVFAGLGNLGSAGGTLYSDSSLYGRDGVLTGYTNPVASWSRALGRSQLGFIGASSTYVDISSIKTLAAPYSVSLWANPTTLAQDSVLVSLSLPNHAFGMYASGSTLPIGPTAAECLNTISNYLTAGKWQHWLICRPATGIVRFWLDGVERTLVTNTNFSVYNMNIGARQNGASRQFTGGIADVVITKADLSSFASRLADPSNVMLDGLIRPPCRIHFPTGYVPKFTFYKYNWYKVDQFKPSWFGEGKPRISTDSFNDTLPDTEGDSVGTVEGTGGSTPFYWEIISQLLV